MRFIGKTKIEQKRSKPTIAYPLIRLPKEYAEVIGTPAAIYQTRCDDSTAFVVVLDDKDGHQPKGKVGQLSLKVGQPRNKKVLEARLSALEKEISAIKSLILLNESDSFHEIEKQWARGDLNSGSPPCKGSVRHMEPELSFSSG